MFDMDSDGYVGDFDSGVDGGGDELMQPLRNRGGERPVLFRKRYGRSIAMWGGVDKRVMARGGEEIREELERILPFMFKEGGYIPTCRSWCAIRRFMAQFHSLCAVAGTDDGVGIGKL